jgi:hypothetical protein
LHYGSALLLHIFFLVLIPLSGENFDGRLYGSLNLRSMKCSNRCNFRDAASFPLYFINFDMIPTALVRNIKLRLHPNVAANSFQSFSRRCLHSASPRARMMRLGRGRKSDCNGS